MSYPEEAPLSMPAAGATRWPEPLAGRGIARIAIPAVILVALLAGVSAAALTTRWGIGASPDSVAYIGAARNLASGRGLSLPYGELADLPLTRFPPLYPMILAGLGGLTGDAATAARWLQALLIAANAALVAVFVSRISRRAAWTAALGSLVWMASPAMLELHSLAWSEPLFLFLGTGTLLLLGESLEGEGWRRAAGAGLLAGLASLTRYAGISLLATGGLALMLWGAGTRRERLASVFAFVATGAALPLLWMARNLRLTGNAAARPIGFHPVGMTQVWQAVDTLARWLQIPRGLPGIAEAALIIVIAAATLALLLGIGRDRRVRSVGEANRRAMPGLLRVALLHVAVYAAFLLASISLVDANTPLDSRILSPLYPIGIIALMSAVDSLARSTRKLRPMLFPVLAGLGAWLVFSAGSSAALVREGYQLGLGFNRAEWRVSPTLARVAGLPEASVLYSNSPEAIYFRTGRGALPLPQRFSSVSQSVNVAFPAQVSEIRQMIADRGGAVVYFANLAGTGRMSEDDLRDLLGLEPIYVEADGSIYAPGG